jgi:hypothetical protein
MYFLFGKAVFLTRQQKTTAFGRGCMRQLLAGMSPHLGVSQAPRALPVGLHSRGAGSQGGGRLRRLTNPLFSNTMNKLNARK